MLRYLFITLIIIGCNQDDTLQGLPFPKEDNLRKYMLEIHDKEKLDDGLLYLIDNRSCGPCNEFTINFIAMYDNNDLTLVITDESDHAVDSLKQAVKGNYLVDRMLSDVNSKALEAYGLSSSQVIVFMVEEDNIIDWSFLNHENQNEVNNLGKRLSRFNGTK